MRAFDIGASKSAEIAAAVRLVFSASSRREKPRSGGDLACVVDVEIGSAQIDQQAPAGKHGHMV